MTWRMPSETEPHERIWMAYPPRGYVLGDSAEDADEARRTWTAVAHAVAEFEPVTMVVDPADAEVARRHLGSHIDRVDARLDDAWMRDIGPTFVVDDDGGLAGVDWVFNGWGRQPWARWDRDRRIARTIIDHAEIEWLPSTIVNEGGGIHVDGVGTVLLTETVQLDPERNPGASKADVEAELARTLGVTTAVWFRRGLTRDSQAYGTRGHVDIVATIPSPGVLLVHDQRDLSHPDHEVTREVLEVAAATTDAAGRSWEVVPVPAPRVLRDADGWVDYSFINHVVVNGGVVACSFGDPADDEAREILAGAYPGREVVTVDARPLFARGGGIHCITQQQPRV